MIPCHPSPVSAAVAAGFCRCCAAAAAAMARDDGSLHGRVGRGKQLHSLTPPLCPMRCTHTRARSMNVLIGKAMLLGFAGGMHRGQGCWVVYPETLAGRSPRSGKCGQMCGSPKASLCACSNDSTKRVGGGDAVLATAIAVPCAALAAAILLMLCGCSHQRRTTSKARWQAERCVRYCCCLWPNLLATRLQTKVP